MILPDSARFFLAPGIALCAALVATRPVRAAGAPPAPILVTPQDRVLLQRGFVPVDGALRLYACVVGTPAGVHYAYDLGSGTLLSVWRGQFADLVELWGPRSRNQTIRPAGNEIAIAARPLLAQFPDRPMIAFPQSWPDQPAPLYSSDGYELERDGQPVFLARLEDLRIRDRIAPLAGGRGLRRRLEFSGRLPEWQTSVLLAEAEAIAPDPGGAGWTARKPGWSIHWAAGSAPRPVLRDDHGGQQLVLRLERSHLDEGLSYDLTW